MSDVSNTNLRDDTAAVHENRKADAPAHTVVQLVSSDSFVLDISNLHGSNELARSEDALTHFNISNDQHTVEQLRAAGGDIVSTINANGENLVLHTDAGILHINTHNPHDDWVI